MVFYKVTCGFIQDKPKMYQRKAGNGPKEGWDATDLRVGRVSGRGRILTTEYTEAVEHIT